MTRSATPDDLSYFYDLYMHPAVNRFLLYEEMTIAEFTPVYLDLLEKKSLFIFSDGGKDIGMFKLLPQWYRNAHIVYLGGLAIHPDYFGSGYSRAMMQEIIEMARQRGFLRIELSVAATNERAIRLYESAGFQREGLLRNYTWLAKENTYLDEVMMAKLMNE
jgi:putative acetyltransferase